MCSSDINVGVVVAERTECLGDTEDVEVNRNGRVPSIEKDIVEESIDDVEGAEEAMVDVVECTVDVEASVDKEEEDAVVVNFVVICSVVDVEDVESMLVDEEPRVNFGVV